MQLFIVTGTSKGIGKALKNVLIKRGHLVVGISRSKTISQLNYLPIQFDLSQSAKIETDLAKKLSKMVDRNIKKSLSGVHLINNAAQLEPIGSVADISYPDLNKALQLNLVAPILLTKCFIQLSKNIKGNKSITNISSGVAYQPLPGWSVYSISKAALLHYSKSLKLELPKDYQTYSLSPGIVDTNMQSQIRRKSTKQFSLVEKFKDYHKNNQLADPEFVANEIADLLLSNKVQTEIEVRIEKKF